MKCLFICPTQSIVNQLKELCKCADNLEKKKHSGVGTIYESLYFGFVVMASRLDSNKLCRRMHKAATILDYQQVVVIHYDNITYDTFRTNHLSVPLKMFIIDDRMALNGFMAPYGFFLNEVDDGIFHKRKRTPKKRKLLKREIKVEQADKDEDCCVICFDNKITHMFIPCMHFQFCGPCSEQIKKDPCPICRVKIESVATPIMR